MNRKEKIVKVSDPDYGEVSIVNKPMFLSDELLEIRRKANPKNNQSQGDAAFKMLKRLREESSKIEMAGKLKNIVVFVCDTLNKEGFKFYRWELFFEAPAERGKK